MSDRKFARQMIRRQMRFAKQNEDRSLGMTLPDLGQFQSRVAITRANFSQVFARHAIQPVKSLRVIARARPGIHRTAPNRIPNPDQSECVAATRSLQSRDATIHPECADRGQK